MGQIHSSGTWPEGRWIAGIQRYRLCSCEDWDKVVLHFFQKISKKYYAWLLMMAKLWTWLKMTGWFFNLWSLLISDFYQREHHQPQSITTVAQVGVGNWFHKIPRLDNDAALGQITESESSGWAAKLRWVFKISRLASCISYHTDNLIRNNVRPWQWQKNIQGWKGHIWS